MLQLAIIIIYFIIVVVLGIFTRKQAKDATNFFVAGRGVSSQYMTGSLVATIVGGSATIGMAGLGFSRGLTGGWWLLSGSIGLIILAFFFARKVREFGVYTLPEIMEKQYDGKVALAGSILIVVSWIGVIAGQIIAAGKIMSVLGLGGAPLWMCIFTVVFVSYVTIGGQWADIKTDLWQGIIIFIGIFAGVGFVISKFGGFSGLWNSLPAGYSSFPLSPGFDTYQLVKLLLLVGLTYVVGPDMYSRILSAKNGHVAKVSVFWSAFILIPMTFAVVLIGMSAKVIYPDIASEQAFPAIINGILPPVLNGLVLAALLAAVMSSADSCLLSAGTILSVDVIHKFKPSLNEKQVLSIARYTIVVIGALSLLLALFLKGVISSLMFAYTIYTAGIIPLVITGFFKKNLKVTSLGAFSALIGGGGAALVSQLFKIKYLDLGALVISFVILFAVSAIERNLKAKVTV
jgi:SSS family solute:Na+ symporter